MHPIVSYECSVVCVLDIISCAIMADPTEMPFPVWTRVGQGTIY